MYRTELKVSREQFRRTNIRWGNHYRRLLWQYRLLGRRSDFSDSYLDFTSRKQDGPLTPERVAVVRAQQADVDRNYADRTREMDVSTDITPDSITRLSSRIRFANILQEFLRDNPQVQSVANTGARVDFYSAYLARRLPGVRFVSVDLQPNLAMHNSLLPQSPNWTFLTGYSLNLLRSAALKADLYFSVSTSVLMNNRELDVYLDEIAMHAKAVAFCEGWWPRADSFSNRIMRPEDIQENEPYCSGDYANYHHNYVAKLERRGFAITLSQIVPESERYHYLQIVAVKQ